MLYFESIIIWLKINTSILNKTHKIKTSQFTTALVKCVISYRTTHNEGE